MKINQTKRKLTFSTLNQIFTALILHRNNYIHGHPQLSQSPSKLLPFKNIIDRTNNATNFIFMLNSRTITMRSSVVVVLLLPLLLSIPAATSRDNPDKKAPDLEKEETKTDIKSICDKAGENSDLCLSTSRVASPGPGALDHIDAKTVMHFLLSAALRRTKDEQTKGSCVKHYEFALEQGHLVAEAIKAGKLDEMNEVLDKIEGAYKKCELTPPEIPKLLAAVKALGKEFLPA